jgi:hypothetical protein
MEPRRAFPKIKLARADDGCAGKLVTCKFETGSYGPAGRR